MTLTTAEAESVAVAFKLKATAPMATKSPCSSDFYRDGRSYRI
ncbi:hypothetical protein V2U47_08335 [Streptococcus agalactiae]